MPPFIKVGKIPRPKTGSTPGKLPTWQLKRLGAAVRSGTADPHEIETFSRQARLLEGLDDIEAKLEAPTLETVRQVGENRYEAVYRTQTGEELVEPFDSDTPIESEPLTSYRERGRRIGSLQGLADRDVNAQDRTQQERKALVRENINDSQTRLRPFQEDYAGSAAQERAALKASARKAYSRVAPGNSVEREFRKDRSMVDRFGEEVKDVDEFGNVLDTEASLLRKPGPRRPVRLGDTTPTRPAETADDWRDLPPARPTNDEVARLKSALLDPNARIDGDVVRFVAKDIHGKERVQHVIAASPEGRAWLAKQREFRTVVPEPKPQLERHMDIVESQARRSLRGDDALVRPGVTPHEAAALERGEISAVRTTHDAPKVRFYTPDGDLLDLDLAPGVPLHEADAAKELGLTERMFEIERQGGLIGKDLESAKLAQVRPLAGAPPVNRKLERAPKAKWQKERDAASVPPLPNDPDRINVTFPETPGERKWVGDPGDPENPPQQRFIPDNTPPEQMALLEGFGAAFSAEDGPLAFRMRSYVGGMRQDESGQWSPSEAFAGEGIPRGKKGRGVGNVRALQQSDTVIVFGIKRGEDGRIILPAPDDPTFWAARAAQQAERLGKRVIYNENAEGVASSLHSLKPGERVYITGSVGGDPKVAAGFAKKVQRLMRQPGVGNDTPATTLRKLSKVARAVRAITGDSSAMKKVQTFLQEAEENDVPLSMVERPYALADGSIVFAHDVDGRAIAIQPRSTLRGFDKDSRPRWDMADVRTREVTGSSPADDPYREITLPKRFLRVYGQEVDEKGWVLIGVDPTTGKGAVVKQNPDGSWTARTDRYIASSQYEDLGIPPLQGNAPVGELLPGQKVTLSDGQRGEVVNPVARLHQPPEVSWGLPDRTDAAQMPMVMNRWDAQAHSPETTLFIGTPEEKKAMGIPEAVTRVGTVEAAKTALATINQRDSRGLSQRTTHSPVTAEPYAPGERAAFYGPRGVQALQGPALRNTADDPLRQGLLWPRVRKETRTSVIPERDPKEGVSIHIVAGPSAYEAAALTFPGVQTTLRRPIQPEDAAFPGLVSVRVPSKDRVSAAVQEIRRITAALEKATDPQEITSLEAALTAAKNARMAELSAKGNPRGTSHVVRKKGREPGSPSMERRTSGIDSGEMLLLPRTEIVDAPPLKLPSDPVARATPVEDIGQLGAATTHPPVAGPSGEIIPPKGAFADSAAETLELRRLMDTENISLEEARARLETAGRVPEGGELSPKLDAHEMVTQLAAEAAMGNEQSQRALFELVAYVEAQQGGVREGPAFDLAPEALEAAIVKGQTWAAAPEGQTFRQQQLAKHGTLPSSAPDYARRFAALGLSALAAVFLGEDTAEAGQVPSWAKVKQILHMTPNRAHPQTPGVAIAQTINSVNAPIEHTMSPRQVEEFRRLGGQAAGQAEVAIRPVLSAREAFAQSVPEGDDLLTQALVAWQRLSVFDKAEQQLAKLEMELNNLPPEAPPQRADQLITRIATLRGRMEKGEISPHGATREEVESSAVAELLARPGGAEALDYVQTTLLPLAKESRRSALIELYGPKRAEEMLKVDHWPLTKQLNWDIEADAPRPGGGGLPELPPETLSSASPTTVHNWKGSIDELEDPWKAFEKQTKQLYREAATNRASRYASDHLVAVGAGMRIPTGQRPPDLGPGMELVSHTVAGERVDTMLPIVFARLFHADQRDTLGALGQALERLPFGRLIRSGKGVLSTAMTGASLPFAALQMAIDIPSAILGPRYGRSMGARASFLKEYGKAFADEWLTAWNPLRPFSEEAKEVRNSGAAMGGWAGIWSDPGEPGMAVDNFIGKGLGKVASLTTSPHEIAVKRAALKTLKQMRPELSPEMHAADVRANAGTPDLLVKGQAMKIEGFELATNFVNAQIRVVEQGLKQILDPEVAGERLVQAVAGLGVGLVALPAWNRWVMGDEEYARQEQLPGTLYFAVPGTEETLEDGRTRPLVLSLPVPKYLSLILETFEQPIKAAVGAKSWTQAGLDYAENFLPGQADLKETAIGESLIDRGVSMTNPMLRYPLEVKGTGRRSLTGAPIESGMLTRRLPQDRINAGTGATAKGITALGGETAGLSPVRVQHAIDTLLPGLLGAPIHGIDKVLAPEGTLTGSSTQEMLRNSNPISRRFVASTLDAQSEAIRDRFGALYAKMNQARISANLPYPTQPQETAWLLSHKEQFDQLQALMSASLRRERMVTDVPNAPYQTKQAVLREEGAVQRGILRGMAQALENYERRTQQKDELLSRRR